MLNLCRVEDPKEKALGELGAEDVLHLDYVLSRRALASGYRSSSKNFRRAIRQVLCCPFLPCMPVYLLLASLVDSNHHLSALCSSLAYSR